MIDSLGLLIAVICMSAQIHDIKVARMMVNRLHNEANLSRIRYLHADGAYKGLDTRDKKVQLELSGLPKKSGFEPLPQRWKVERSISWTRGYRRLNMDYEKKVRYSEAWVYISSIQIAVKKLEKLA